MALKFAKPDSTRDRVAYKREREQDLRAAMKDVWARDQGHCRACLRFVTNRSFGWDAGHVHHLVKRSQSKALRARVSNLVLICHVCHADIHAYRLVIHGTDANRTLRFEWVT